MSYALRGHVVSDFKTQDGCHSILNCSVNKT